MAVVYGSEYRTAVLAGVNVLADAVRITLGPKGRNVAMPQKRNIRGADYSDAAAPDAPVLLTNDGVTIARGIVLADPVQDMGAQLCKSAAIAANEEAGDGTTTAIVVAQRMLQEAFRAVEAGAEPLAVRRGVEAALRAALDSLAAGAKRADSEEDLARVAAISCEDEELGALIGAAVHRVGPEGVVDVDESRRLETDLDVRMGIVFDRGFASPFMTTDSAHSEAELDDPYILLTDKRITDAQDLIPALICAAEDGRDMLIVSGGVEGDALALVMENSRQGDMNVVCVECPAYGEGRRWRMDDLAVQTGGIFLGEGMGFSLRDIVRDMLGHAEHVKVTRKRTIITGGGGDPEAVRARENQLRNYVRTTDYEFNRERYKERLATFVSGIATVRVGGATEAEVWERKMRVEDAVAAARAARSEGIVAGGGAALLQAADSVEAMAGELSGDERAGACAVAVALRAPARQIADNAGKSGSVVVEKLRGEQAGQVYDAAHDAYADPFDAGIIDPLCVVRSSLEAACSIVGTTLITEAGVANPAKAARERAAQREDEGLS